MFPEGAAPGGPPGCRTVEGTALASVRRGTVGPVTCGASRFLLSRRFLTGMWGQSEVPRCAGSISCFVGIHCPVPGASVSDQNTLAGHLSSLRWQMKSLQKQRRQQRAAAQGEVTLAGRQTPRSRQCSHSLEGQGSKRDRKGRQGGRGRKSGCGAPCAVNVNRHPPASLGIGKESGFVLRAVGSY